MSYYSPDEILEMTRQKGITKANTPFLKLLLLAILGGIYISLGFMAFVRVSGTMPPEWGSFRTLLS